MKFGNNNSFVFLTFVPSIVVKTSFHQMQKNPLEREETNDGF